MPLVTLKHIRFGDKHAGVRIPSQSRFDQEISNLSGAREESFNKEDITGRARDDTYREFHTNDNEDNQQDSEDEDSDDLANWDEESTLVAMLDSE